MYIIYQTKNHFLDKGIESGAGESPEKKVPKIEKPTEQKLSELDTGAKKLVEKGEKKLGDMDAQARRIAEAEAGKKSPEGEKNNNIPKAPLEAEKANEILATLPEGPGEMVIPDRVRESVVKKLSENPIDTEGLSEEEVQEEIQKRVVAAKVAEMGDRELIPAIDGKPGQTEADYIASLEEKYGLDNDALMSLRARNQAGIGGEVDTTGKIADPEAYKQQMEALAQNAQKAKEYLDQNKALLDAGNSTIAANAAAILEGKDPTTLTPEDTQRYTEAVSNDAKLGDGFSSLGRLTGNASGGFDSIGSGVGNINLDPGQLANLPATSPEKAQNLGQIFGSSIQKYGAEYGIPQEWANNPSLHKVVMKESGGIVGRLNYTFDAVAKRMGTKINDPQFITFVHNKLKAGAKASDFGIRSTATGVGQMIRSNVIAYYPDKFQGIGNPDNECIGMLRYIKQRYKTPENVVAQYGKHHEGY